MFYFQLNIYFFFNRLLYLCGGRKAKIKIFCGFQIITNVFLEQNFKDNVSKCCIDFLKDIFLNYILFL